MLRQENEETEEEILRRILGLEKVSDRNGNRFPISEGEFFDGRHNVHFPEGFSIFRVYKGQVFTAVVENRKWLLRKGERVMGTYGSLNKLSRAVIDRGNENAWISGLWTVKRMRNS